MADVSFQGTPDWYGGSTGVLREDVDEARKIRQLPYEPYTPAPGTSRIAPFSPLQQESFDLARRIAQPSPQYGQAQNAIQNSLNRNIYGEVHPYLQRGTTAPGAAEIGQFMNPYQQQVVENIGRLGSRNLIENILPNIQNRFISSGQYGSTGHQNLTNRAIRDTQEAISNSQAQALHGGYNTALQAALGQQERQLQGGQLAGSIAGREADRQLFGAEALQNLAGAEQTHGLRGTGILSQLGGQQQQQEQNAANIAHQNFVEQRNFPYKQAAFFNEMIRGLPVNTQIYGSNVQPTPPMAPQSSPYTQAGGLLAGVSGLMNQRQGYAQGGEVKKLSHHRHYAEGGSLSPIQQGANAAIDTAELKDMRNQAQRLSTPQVDPFWSSIARAGFNIAANRQPGVLAKLGEAGNAGLNEYQSQLTNQDQRGLQSAKIMSMIDATRRLQAENDRKHQLDLEKFGQQKKQFEMNHGISAGHLALAKEDHDLKKKMLEKGNSGTEEKTKAQQDQDIIEADETKVYKELYNLLEDPKHDPTIGALTNVRRWSSQNLPFVGKVAGEGLSNQQAYAQGLSILKGLLFKKFKYRNQAEFENIRTLEPNLPREEALEFVKHELRKRGVEIPDEGKNKEIGASNEETGIPNETQQPFFPEKKISYVKVQDPTTGEMGLLSPDEAKIAISRGGVLIE